MSLSSIIYNMEAIREGLRARTVKPTIRFDSIRAPSRTANYGIVGTAFDYLLRFFLQRINKSAQTTIWVAELGVERIGASEYVYDLDQDALLTNADRLRRRADKYISEAKAEHLAYLRSGAVTDKLLTSVLRLAYLDVALRVGPERIDWSGIKSPNPQDLADLRALLALVSESSFKARQLCLLNPSFGAASRLVGGADADLLIDDCLIDIKTTKAPRIDPRDFFQLVGYYLLYGFDGVHCNASKTAIHEIKYLGIYFSRYGYLWKVAVDEVLPPGSIGDTAKWFFNSVCTSKGQRLKYALAFRGPLAKYLPKGKQARQVGKPSIVSRERKKLMSNRRSHTDARKSSARG